MHNECIIELETNVLKEKENILWDKTANKADQIGLENSLCTRIYIYIGFTPLFIKYEKQEKCWKQRSEF